MRRSAQQLAVPYPDVLSSRQASTGLKWPAYWHTDPSITEREIRQIFRKSCSYLGSLKELSKVGDYITGYMGEIPVLVVRNSGGLAGFINVCRHRRHEVMKDRGNTKVMQ